MYFYLTSAIKRKFIEELRRYWADHPKYPELANNIQGKFSFSARPLQGIIVKNSGGTRVDLSADNYVGVVKSYVYLTRAKDKPGHALEWVREDALAIQQNDGQFPSPPGIYYIDVVDDPDQEGEHVFYVDPLRNVFHEPVALLTPTTAQLDQAPLAGTVRLFEMPSGSMLYEGTNYTLDLDMAGNPNGGITFIQAITGGRWVQADYLYPLETQGPFPIYEMHADNRAIPGVVLAFGQRIVTGDQMAVVVQDIRRPAALEYGGHWELSLDFDVTATDVYQQQDILDSSVMFIWAVLRPQMSDQGLEITDLSLGGESEEIRDDTGDDYIYNASFSLVCRTTWSLHVPLDLWLRQASPLTVAQSKELMVLPDDQLAGQEGNIRIPEGLNLESMRDPFWSGRQGTFPVLR